MIVIVCSLLYTLKCPNDYRGRMYSIVSFDDEETVSAVPTSWLIETNENDKCECYWPPKRMALSRIRANVMCRVTPTHDWRTFKCRVLREAPNYERAVRIERECQYFSNTEDYENDQVEKSLKRKKVTTNFDVNTWDFPAQQKTTHASVSSIPAKIRRIEHKNEETNLTIQSQSTSIVLPVETQQINGIKGETPETIVHAPTYDVQAYCTTTLETSTTESTDSTESTVTTISSESTMFDLIKHIIEMKQDLTQTKLELNRTQEELTRTKQLLTQQINAVTDNITEKINQVTENITEKVNQMTENINQVTRDINQKMSEELKQANSLSIQCITETMTRSFASIKQVMEQQVSANLDRVRFEEAVMVPPLPCQTFGAIHELNNLLGQDEAVFRSLFHTLSGLGGDNPKDLIKNIMLYLIPDELALVYTWEGFYGNQCFQELKFMSSVIIKSATSSRNLKLSVSDVHNEVKRYFFAAHDRHKKMLKKKKGRSGAQPDQSGAQPEETEVK